MSRRRLFPITFAIRTDDQHNRTLEVRGDAGNVVNDVKTLLGAVDTTALTAAISAQHTVDNGTYATLAQVAPGVKLYNPYALRRWSSALNDALFGTAVVSVYGDSITKGVGSDGSTADNSATTYPTQSWVGQLRSLFAGTYGDPGEGNVGTLEGGNRWTYAGGGAATASIGPYENGGRVAGNTQTITVALPACTEIDVWQSDISNGFATYNVDSGAAIGNLATGANNSSATTWTKTTITGLANTTHSLVITGGAGSNTYIGAIIARKQTTGVFVHRFGKAGNSTANLVGQDSALNGNTTGQARMIAATAKVPPSDLLIIPLGANDFGNQANLGPTFAQPGTTPATYAANLQATCTQAIASGACVLLLGEPRNVDPIGTGTYTLQQYYDQMKAIALATDHVAFLDVGDLFGSWTDANAVGYMTTTSVHPNRKGHGAMARLVHRALTMPIGKNAPALV